MAPLAFDPTQTALRLPTMARDRHARISGFSGDARGGVSSVAGADGEVGLQDKDGSGHDEHI